jgi:thiol-disulfide isomerase/thioredoxin
MQYKKTITLVVVLAIICLAIAYLEHGKVKHSGSNAPAVAVTSSVHTADYAELAKKYPPAIELVNPDGFINTAPFKIADLVGKKVILVDFWTYSCINCQRTLPYLTDWYNKYKDQGLVIIGIEAPEFEFEKDHDNVVAATKKFGINYPVVQDNELATWDAYNNRYWPADYLIDINGLVVDTHIGEGGYADTEALIQKLLQQRADVLGQAYTPQATTNIAPQPVNTQSPETYFGSQRNEFLANGNQFINGPQTLALPSNIQLNQLYLDGTWNFAGQYSTNTSDTASITYKYDATHVYFVASSDSGADIEIYRDGVKLGGQTGTDRDTDGIVHIKDARLYTLIGEPTAGIHTLTIKIIKGNLKAFTFTFG